MKTECMQTTFHFQELGERKVVAQFNGGTISTDDGALLLREVEHSRGILKQFSKCFTDYRDQDEIEHTVKELISQRVYGIALGYEDLSDHDSLRADQLLAILCGKKDPSGSSRRCKRDKGKALAGKSTLNRLELTPPDASAKDRYKKIVYGAEKIEEFFIDTFLRSHGEIPDQIILDLDATDNPLYGNQEGRFFHGYYDCYCYLPLYIFCGSQLLCAKLRPSDIDGSAGSKEEVERIVKHIRKQWPKVRIILRGDSGFAREELMSWCEANSVDYLFGLAKNARLLKKIEGELNEAQKEYDQTEQASRVYKDFIYSTMKSWSNQRRVVGKAEHLRRGPNPRFVVTSLKREEIDARTLYEKEYCARGEMENRIKEQQLYLFADRTSTETMRANQLRLWFSSVAYVLLDELRRIGLCSTDFAKAQCHTIRNKLFKIGAQIRISVRRICVSLADGYPYQRIFRQAYDNLRMAYSLSRSAET
ncbi:MAG: IS1380 family transposase [Deltaproteobacteria bacterium]|nr:IS1380 family transposase [Deltaproteobacteria bacterium]